MVCDNDYAITVVCSISPDKETKYLVFESCLLALFSTCPACNYPTQPTTHTFGTLLYVTQSWKHCAHEHSWESQAFVKGVPPGNQLRSASILIAGALPSKTLRVLRFLVCASIMPCTLYNHQKWYLLPTIYSVWKEQQSNMISVLQAFDEPLTLGGDGRSDSPGHSAKLGSYTMMDLENNAVLVVWLVQVCAADIVYVHSKLNMWHWQ